MAEDQTDQKDDEQVTLNRSAIRSMEQDAKDAKNLRKEMAFMKAGIDTEKGVGKLAFGSYDGEPTAEAVRAYAEEYGITTGTTEEKPPAADESRYGEDEARSTDQRSLVTSGTTNADDGAEHPSDVAVRVGRDALKTRTNEDAMVAAIVSKATAAHNGDRRALVQEAPR